MKALRFYGKEDLRLEDIDEPKVGHKQVKLRCAWGGICGTDLHEYLGGANLIPTTPHPITKESVPLTLGHEFSGTVEELGSGVTKLKVGDRVCLRPTIYDGTCRACRDGAPNCCWSNGFVGLSGFGGGLSDYVAADEDRLFKLPENVSLEVGALIEPLAVAWHSVKASPYKPGDTVLLLGSGPIGLAVILALKARGDCTIIVSEPSAARGQFARDFGAAHVLDPTKCDLVAEVKKLCGDAGGVDVTFDAAGVQAALTQGIRATRALGTIVNIAVWEKPPQVEVNELVFKERKYMGIATYWDKDFEEVLEAISSGKMAPAKMITKKCRLENVVEEGFMALVREKDRLVKVLVEMKP